MKISNLRQVHDVSDEQLRQLTHEHRKVFVKFTSENCAVCARLAPPFAKFADDDEFRYILFLRLNSDENPVAKKIMQEKVAPFFVAYCQGRILECDMLLAEQVVLAMLRRLQGARPEVL